MVVVVAAGNREVIPTMIQTGSSLLLTFLLLHTQEGGSGLGEYNFAGVCGVSGTIFFVCFVFCYTTSQTVNKSTVNTAATLTHPF